MQTRNSTWEAITATGDFGLNVRAVINGKTYTTISAPIINRALFPENLSVGNCMTASLELTILTEDVIPKSASVVIQAQVFNESRTSNQWITFGTFWISTRETDTETGLVKLQCYDAMKKATRPYISDPTSSSTGRVGWPKAMSTCVSEIVSLLGLGSNGLDSRTKIKTGSDYVLNYPAHYVTTNTSEETQNEAQMANYTIADALRIIGAFHGGNWVITPENKLRLVPLIPSPAANTPSTSTNGAGGKVLSVPVVTGEIKTGHSVTISRITVKRDDQEQYSKGDDTGLELVIEGSQYETPALHKTACNDLYSALYGIVYDPYTMTQACYDPCAELGDWVVAGDRVRGVLCAQTVKFGIDFRADISAPGQDEAEDEFPSELQRLRQDADTMKAFAEQASSSIIQTKERISLEVTRATAEEGRLEGRIDVNADQILLRVKKGEVSSEISVESGEVRITGNRLVVQSTNFYLDRQGNVDITGDFTTTDYYSKLTMQSGGFNLYNVENQGETLVGRIRGDSRANSTANSSTAQRVMKIEADAGGIIFANGSNYDFAYNTGLNPRDYRERFIFMDDAVFDEDIKVRGDLVLKGHVADSSDGTDHIGTSVIRYGAFHTSGTSSYEDNVTIESGLVVYGNFKVMGDKKTRAVKTEHYGVLCLDAMESTVPVFSDLGSGTIDDTGLCYVFFDPDFSETIDLTHAYQVFLTQTSEGAVHWTDKQPDHFIVHGKPGTTFDWVVYARQLNCATDRLVRVEDLTQRETILIDESMFAEDNRPANICEAYMDSFADNLEEQDLAYLENYEKEISDL